MRLERQIPQAVAGAVIGDLFIICDNSTPSRQAEPSTWLPSALLSVWVILILCLSWLYTGDRVPSPTGCLLTAHSLLLGRTCWALERYLLRFTTSSFQSLSWVRFFAAPWTAACQASLSFTISWSLLKLMSIESVMPSSHLILCNLLLLVHSIFPNVRVFSKESVLGIRWPKY